MGDCDIKNIFVKIICASNRFKIGYKSKWPYSKSKLELNSNKVELE